MAVLTEGRHAAEFILSEANLHRSRDNLTVAENQDFQPGTVLALLAIPDEVTASAGAAAGNTGDGTLTLADPAVSAKAKNGVYRVTATDATTFAVESPSGVSIGNATVGQAFNKEVKFTIAAGGTAFVAGDAFEITVGVESPADFHAVAYDPNGTDGSEVPGAIAIYRAKTGAGETVRIAGLVREAEVMGPMLEWPTGITAVQQAAAIEALRDKGIIVR